MSFFSVDSPVAPAELVREAADHTWDKLLPDRLLQFRSPGIE
jgi:hypothetical protein